MGKCRHNLFLHSALVISRKIPHSFEGIRVSKPTPITHRLTYAIATNSRTLCYLCTISVYILSLFHQSARKYFLLESSLALFIAFLINVAIISVSGSVCWNRNLSSESKDQCANITLNSAAFLLKVLTIFPSDY